MVDISIANDSDLGQATVVLVGCTGSGKSATGNSILGRKAFQSISCFGRVTTVCTRQATVLEDGRILNVIDTPGLFDSSSKPELVEKEIVRCMEMAKDGIHAILMVVSLKVRSSEEQGAVVETLKHLFGARIVDYMIVVFTGGDDLGENQTLDDHLARTCPQSLKDLLEMCGNRRVVFDNKTKDEAKKAKQLHKLLTLINNVIVKNGGKPYTHELFVQFKNEAAERDSENSQQQMRKAYDEEQMQQHIAAMFQEKLKEKDDETVSMLKQDLERVQMEANERLKEQQDAKNEMLRLREQVERAQREAANRRKKCPFL